ncbi:MAG: hypothetical protein H8D34_26430 [Chloroflexi bacterium]|nr:hypothetical protein [Chloroflexota bacterium]
MRAVRCRNPQNIGTLAGLLTAISESGGFVGSIRTIFEGYQGRALQV